MGDAGTFGWRDGQDGLWQTCKRGSRQAGDDGYVPEEEGDKLETRDGTRASGWDEVRGTAISRMPES